MPIRARIEFAEGVHASFELERLWLRAREGKIEQIGDGHSGSGLPFVSTPSGSSASPARNANEVKATGIPMV